jgi:hypothetical protein
MLRTVPATVEYYAEVIAAFPDTESLTVLTVAGATRDQVAEQLEIDLLQPVEEDAWADSDQSAWALLEIPGGVVAVELSGFADPSNSDLAALSADGAAAVTRSNILAHYRFGCARGGELLFDDDEYVYVEPDTLPRDLQALVDLVHVDLTGDLDDNPSAPGPLTVGLAMAEVVTGLEVTPALVRAVLDSGFFAGPLARYPGPGDSKTHDAESEDKSLRAPCLLTATEGAYVIGASFPGTFSDPPAVWPTDTFFVAVHPDTAWVRKLSPRPETTILVTTVYAETEPIEVLQRAGDAYEHQSSVVLLNDKTVYGHQHTWRMEGDALRIYDCFPFMVQTFLTDQPGTYRLHVFANLPDNDHGNEEHLLVLWPDPDAEPDLRP